MKGLEFEYPIRIPRQYEWAGDILFVSLDSTSGLVSRAVVTVFVAFVMLQQGLMLLLSI